MPTLFQPPRGVIFSGGQVVPSALIYFYITATTTLKSVYSDVQLQTPLPNPVQADSTGKLPKIYLDTSSSLYRVRITDADGTQVDQEDDIGASLGANEVALSLDSLARTTAEISAGVTPSNYSWPPGHVRRYGAVGDNIANDTAAFDRARLVTGGRYHLSAGTYLVDASPNNVWADIFTADPGASIRIGATTYDVSRAFAGPWRFVSGSSVLLKIRHAVSGNDIIQLQDGSPGTATYFQRGLSFDTDSHWVQAAPATNGGSTDILWQRSDANTLDTVTGSISGATLTVSAAGSSNLIAPGCTITGSGVAASTTVTALGSGTGGTGTYTVTPAQTVASTTLTVSDPAGNRFNETFEETADRLIFSMATKYSGTPSFDQYMAPYGPRGAYPQTLQFPGFPAWFRNSVVITQRTDGGFALEMVATSSTQVTMQNQSNGADLLSFTASGVSVGSQLFFQGGTSRGIFCNSGTPEGAQTAPVGSLYLRTDGGANTTLYIKESGSGNTGWVAK